MISLLIFSEAPVVLAGFRSLVAETEDIQLLPADSLEACLAGAAALAPDVVLIEMSPNVDVGTVLAVRRHNAAARVVLWVQAISIEMAHALREVGICGILRKDVSIELMFRCVRRVAAGEVWFDRALLSDLLSARKVNLSPRERQLLTLVSQGRSNERIAAELAIAEGTVKVYLSKLFKKVGVSDRLELALYGLRAMAAITREPGSGGVWSRWVLVKDREESYV